MSKHIYRLFLNLVLVFTICTVVTHAQEGTDGDNIEEGAEDVVELAEDTAQSVTEDLDDFLDRLAGPPESELAQVLLVIGGIVLLLAGWRIYELIILVAGFLAGGSILLAAIGDANTVLEIGAFLVGGIVGALLGMFLFYVAVFLVGTYIGIVMTKALASALALTPVSALALLIGAIIGGIILVGLSFELLILFSALVGAQLLSVGLDLSVEWTIIFAIIGIIAQLYSTRVFGYQVRRRPRRHGWLRRRTF